MSSWTAADADWLVAEMEAAGREELMPRFGDPARLGTRAKGAEDDLVTEADLACEARLGAAIRARLPGALVVGEEAAEDDPDLRGRLDGAELSLILDPVDGTWNYAAGVPLFGIIAAVAERGGTTWGAIHDPVTGTTIRSDAPPEMAPRLGDDLRGTIPIGHMPAAVRGPVAAALAPFGRIGSTGCSAWEYRMLAQGRTDYVLSGELKPWDHAAGALIVERAGGHAAMLDGARYRPGMREDYLLCARDRETWERVRGAIGDLLN